MEVAAEDTAVVFCPTVVDRVLTSLEVAVTTPSMAETSVVRVFIFVVCPATVEFVAAIPLVSPLIDVPCELILPSALETRVSTALNAELVAVMLPSAVVREFCSAVTALLVLVIVPSALETRVSIAVTAELVEVMLPSAAVKEFCSAVTALPVLVMAPSALETRVSIALNAELVAVMLPSAVVKELCIVVTSLFVLVILPSAAPILTPKLSPV
tara:strand:- start:124 stop:762 length:639 start_codon:yes stop_codon:yes gene_type:complete